MFLRVLFIGFVFCGTFIFGGLVYLFEGNWIDLTQLESVRSEKPSVILDDEGKELFRFALDKRTPIMFNQIPDVVIKAFVAAEDHKFFSHMGVSFKGIIRSALVNLYYRRVVQGASTITQQVARLLFLTHERTMWRKIHEVILAMQLERRLSKEQILQLYLNNVYFGRGIYGVEAAVKRFWNKSISDVTLDEAAVLAAIAKSALIYSPLNAPLTAQRRRNTILNSMRLVGFITYDEYKIAREKPLVIEDHIPGNPVRLYIREWIRVWAERKWGRGALYSKGLRIKSTINAKMQGLAEKSFIDIVSKMRKNMGNKLNGGMITLGVGTGKIKCLIGGIDFRQSQFNRAFQAYRQVGSSFKPLLYALALKSGYDMDSIVVDEPIEILQPGGSVWKPRNWNRRYEGAMTLIRSMTYSNNIITIKLLLNLGVEKLKEWLIKFGITHELTSYPSMALGTAHATVKENATAFNTFANNGLYVDSYMIEWVKDKWGKKIWHHKPKSRRLLDVKLNAKMVKSLTYRMKFAKPQWKEWVDCESIGKTGSTNGAATVWFVGSTPEYTSAIYLGKDDNKPLGRYVYANRTAFPIWLNFAKHLKSKIKHFYFDPELCRVAIDWKTGELVDADAYDDNTVVILK